MSKKFQPEQGRNYTLREIIHQLELRDAPCLMFNYKDVMTPVQTSHFSDQDLEANCPQLLNSFWTYKYETDEWVPVFYFYDTLTFASNDLLRHMTVERDIDPFVDDPRKISWWAVPKAFPRPQYYAEPEEKERLKADYSIDVDDPEWREKLYARRQEREAQRMRERAAKYGTH